MDIDTGEAIGYRPHEIEEALAELERASEIWGHNTLGFDEPVIRKLYPHIKLPPCYDTLVLSRLVHPDIKSSDFERNRRWKAYLQATEQGRPWQGPIPLEFPTKSIGSYSLAAWGYRLGEHKGDFVTADNWQTFTEEMFDYMMQDGVVTLELYRKLMAHEPSPQSVELEHRIARLCQKITENGFPFDVDKAVALHGRLVDEREGLRTELLGLFPNWKVRLPDFIPKRPNKTKGYEAGVPVERWKEMEFNPASRDHIADRLIDKYGWKPTLFTDNGKPTVDDDVLSSLPYPEAKKLARFFLLEKRIGQLAEGNQAWLKVQKTGKIHARYTPNGTVTGRSTHSNPNISQVPRVSSEFGRECRELFHVPEGWVQLGADQQGLELRCLASDLSGLAGDGGNYVKVVTTGDVHTTNRIAFGLFTRDGSKTGIYATIYGGGDPRLGQVFIDDARRVGEPLPKMSVGALGKRMKASFMANTPGFKELLDIVQGAAKRGFIKGIDGRKIPIRSSHSALNMRLQNAGAVICKQWGCDWDDGLKAEGLKHGWDGDYVFLSWSHDEYQLAVRDRQDTIDLVQRIGIETGRNAGLPYNFQCPLDVEVKIGSNWAECH